MSGLDELFAGFDRAWAGDDNHFRTANVYPVDGNNGAVRFDLAAYQFERLGDGDDVIDPGSDLQGFNFVAPAAADGGHNRAFGAPRDVRLVAGLPDAVDDMVDLGFGGLLGHVDDHDVVSLRLICALKNKSRDSASRLRLKLGESKCP